MSLGIRGFNPVWLLDDLAGNLFDDTYYMFVLENEFPYLPANVYHDPELNTVWNNPIQFLANGTLPVDIFFESDHVYRLEFRQGDTQADPLIYEVNDYSVGEDSSPILDGNSTSDNQVTNPQFSLISFNSPLVISGTDPDPIEVAPGWFFEAAGSGTATITQVPLSSTNTNASNAPYALEFDLSGWTADSVFLRQRFEQNGMLWANKTISTTITARLDGSPQSISATLVDSQGAPLAQILDPTSVNNDWNQFTDHDTLPATTNTDTPPSAYIDYKLALPSNVDIYITSIQLVVQDAQDLSEPEFIQDSINRQIDHTFNYYKDPLLTKAIPSMLTGWDFPLNPAQFNGSSKTITTSPAYVWDCTVCASSSSTLAVIRNTVTGGLQATSGAATQSYYFLQYLSGNKAKEIILNKLAVNVSGFRNQTGGAATVRVYLYRAPAASTIPVTATGLGTVSAGGIFTLTGAVIADNWTLIPRAGFVQNQGDLSIVNTGNYAQLNDIQDLQFTGWQETLGTKIADTDKFAIVVTVQCPTIATIVTINSIGLVPGDVATRPAPQAIDEVLRECQYFWEKSYVQGTSTATITVDGAVYQLDELNSVTPGAKDTLYLQSIWFNFKEPKRNAPTISFWSPTGVADKVQGIALRNGFAIASVFPTLNPNDYDITNWGINAFLTGVQMNCVSTTIACMVTATQDPGDEAQMRLHFTANARYGDV